MNYSTLNLYLIAGGTSACLCALLWALSRYKSDAQLLKSTLGSILLFSVAFTVSGFGPDLPRWMTVVGSNMVILSAGVFIYGGLLTYRASRDPFHTEFIPSFDWWGWGTLASTAPAFWYWGLVEPDGHTRSAVFSFAAAAISGRTAHLLVREAWRQRRNRLLWAIAALFATIAIWMLARATLFTWFEPPPATDKGANPTSWVTVAGFIAMMSVLTTFMTWLEFDNSGLPSTAGSRGSGATVRMGVVSFFWNKLLVMWTTVAIAVMGVGGEATLFFAQTLEWENERQLQAISAATDLSASHTQQMFNQVDTVLHAVRSFYQRTGSLEETQRFIDSLPLDTAVIDNIYLVSPQAITLLAHDPSQAGIGKTVDDHLRFHKTHSADLPYVSATEAGHSPGKQHFRVTRCIDGSDGNFNSLVLVSVNPSALTDYYNKQLNSTHHVSALIGTTDHMFRATWPSLPANMWGQPVSSPLWQKLPHAPIGQFRNSTLLDGLDRLFVYKQLEQWPLVMATGFSDADVASAVYRRMRWPALGVVMVLGSLLVLAGLLTIEIKRRQEQDNFMAMLSHELKTPLSVLRMALGNQSALTERTREYALQAVQDMDTIIYRCLQADRLKQKDTPVHTQPCQVAEVLADLHIAYSQTARLNMATATDLPTLQTDPQLVSIALNNLLDNALKYAPPHSPIHITAKRHTHQRQPGVLVTVSNTEGQAGRPDAQWVFKKYHRGTRAHSKSGSGLGLYLVHTVARLLGGWVRYAPTDQLVTFELWLPETR